MTSEKKYKLFLKGDREFDMTYDESVMIAKCIMLFPSWKKIKFKGVVFCTDDIDYERSKKYKRRQLDMFEKDTQKLWKT